MRERGGREEVLDGRRSEKVQDVPRGERETIDQMSSGCGEMRKREAKEREEILKEDGRETGCMKEIWKRREMIEKENVNFLELYFYVCNQELESPKGK
jgi:hypothetical protein